MAVTNIRLAAYPGRKKVEHGYSSTQIALCIGSGTPTRTVHTASLAEITTAVATFGKDVLAANPDTSFIIMVDVAKGQRKPRGFDAADNARQFGQEAFLRSDINDDALNRKLVLPAAAAAA